MSLVSYLKSKKNPKGSVNSELFPLDALLNFSERACTELDVDSSSVIYGHGVETLSTLIQLKEIHGCKIVCDVIETPDYSERSVKRRWKCSVISFLNHSTESMLRNCDQLTTVSSSLKTLLLKFNQNVCVLENYLDYKDLKKNNFLREKFNLSEKDKIVLCANLISSGFENVLDMLAELPKQYHVITVGNFLPRTYYEHVLSYAKKIGVSERMHIHGKIKHEDYHSIISGADIGVVVLSSEIENHQLSLPNRVFDYLSADLPFLAYDVGETPLIIQQYKVGEILNQNPKEDAKLLPQVLNNRRQYVQNIQHAKVELCWDRIKSKILNQTLLSGAEKVIFVGVEDLRKNPRKQRIEQALIEAGTLTDIYFEVLF